MSEKTNIAWCDSTVNFWSGCTKVSPGCANCYAEALSNNRFFGGGGTLGKWGKGAPRRLHESAFKMAFKIQRKQQRRPVECPKCHCISSQEPGDDCIRSHHGCDGKMFLPPHRVFSLSLGDWLDNEVPIEWLERMLDTIRQCPDVTWILCTKRPENFYERTRLIARQLAITGSAPNSNDDLFYKWLVDWRDGKPPTNIILLTSIENQEQADKRVPELLKIPAICHGLSLEPLLGPIELRNIQTEGAYALNCLKGERRGTITRDIIPCSNIDWLIIGGESGPKARPCNVEWIRSLVEQGKAAGVATFVKQLGARPVEDIQNARGGYAGFQRFGNITDKKGGGPQEWPTELRIQEWPKL